MGKLLAWINRRGRLFRMIVAGIVALSWAVFFSQIVNVWLWESGAIAETIWVPMLVATAAGVLGYGVGWWMLIGFEDGRVKEIRGGGVIYVLSGAAGIAFTLCFVIMNLAWVNRPMV